MCVYIYIYVYMYNAVITRDDNVHMYDMCLHATCIVGQGAWRRAT